MKNSDKVLVEKFIRKFIKSAGDNVYYTSNHNMDDKYVVWVGIRLKPELFKIYEDDDNVLIHYEPIKPENIFKKSDIYVSKRTRFSDNEFDPYNEIEPTVVSLQENFLRKDSFPILRFDKFTREFNMLYSGGYSYVNMKDKQIDDILSLSINARQYVDEHLTFAVYIEFLEDEDV